MKFSKCWCKLPENAYNGENIENKATISQISQNCGEFCGKLHKIHFRGICGK